MATSIQLSTDTEQRLTRLVSLTGRTKDFYLRELIDRGMDDIEDYYLANEVLERIRKGQEEIHDAEDVRREFGVDD